MKKLKFMSLCLFLFSIAIGIIFWFTQIRKSDRIGPVIQVDEAEVTVDMRSDDKDFLKGVTATDNEDGDVTSSVVVESVSNFLSDGRRKIVYAAVDSHNNVGRASRIVKYKGYHSPEVSLSSPLSFPTTNSSDTSQLTDGLTVQDMIDGDISNQVKILTSSAVSLYYPGEYPVRFSVDNSAGDTVSFNATLNVYDADSTDTYPFIHLKHYLVYTTIGKKVDAAKNISKVCLGGGFNSKENGTIDASKVKIDDGDVDYNKAGSYEVSYSVKEKGTQTGKVKLIVIVTE